ncbi:MAG TPA: chromate efflux transporter [Candidatus Limnocylindria bacterium]|nr:chromate efflux transporter [Candidatus Limnocylindria bacterium]
MVNKPLEVPFRAAVRLWAYVGLNSFGGPAGQIAVMHREIVERRKWIDEQRFLHALNYCMLLPGPEAQQLATYIGWYLNGMRGGLVAGLFFVLPGVAVLLVLSALYALYHETALLAAVFYGVKPAVVALVAQAFLRLAGRTLKTNLARAIAAAAFLALFFFDVPFPLIVIGAGLIGVIAARRAPVAADAEPVEKVARPPMGHTLRTAGTFLVIWLTPVALCFALLGPGSIFTQLTLFFGFAALISFGGAYALLSFIAQQAVDVYGWLSAPQMVDGLGLAETTPGPLIVIVQFVGFMAAFAQPGGMDPVAAGVVGGLLVSWVTFAPTFLWIFTGAPYVEYLRSRNGLNAALGGIGPAVVGVILNLAAWFALQTFFGVTGEFRAWPLRIHTFELASIDLFAIALAIAAFVALVRLKWPLLLTLALSAAIGAGYYLLLRT